MTPRQLKKIRSEIGLTQKELGDKLELSMRSIRRYESKEFKRLPVWLEYAIKYYNYSA